MFNKLFLISGFLLMTLSHSVLAQTLSTAKEVINYGLKNNPEIKAGQQEYQSALQTTRKMSTWMDPQAGVRINGVPTRFASGNSDQNRFFVQQNIPWIGKLGSLKQKGEAMALMQAFRVQKMQKKVVQDIEELLAMLFQVNEKQRIISENKALANQIFKVANAKYKTGKGIQANVLLASISKDEFEEKLLALAAQRQNILDNLKVTLGADDGVRLALEPSATWSAQENFLVQSHQFRTHVAYQMSLIQEHIWTKSKTVADDTNLPTLMARVEYWQNNQIDDQWAGQFGMNIPWLNPKNGAIRKEASYQLEAASLRLKDASEKAKTAIKTMNRDITRVSEQIKLYEDKILPDAKLTLTNYLKSYEVGSVSLIDFLSIQKKLLMLEVRYVELITNQAVLRSKLKEMILEESML